MKRKSRFKSEKDVMSQIDLLRGRIRLNRHEAEKLNIEADVLFKIAGQAENAALKRSKAKALFKRANQIEDTLIPAMSRKLAALRTQPMFFIQNNADTIPKQPGHE